MYRAVTLAALEAGVDARRRRRVRRRSRRRVGIERRGRRDARSTAATCSAEIRGPEVTAAVSTVSAHPGGAARCSSTGSGSGSTQHGGGVVEGRDIGTVVFPDAPVKVFLDRERRRAGPPPPARRGAPPTATSPSTTVQDALGPARRARQRPGGVAAAGGRRRGRDRHDRPRPSTTSSAEIVDRVPSGRVEHAVMLLPDRLRGSSPRARASLFRVRVRRQGATCRATGGVRRSRRRTGR